MGQLGNNVVPFRRYEVTATDIEALRLFIGASRWEPTFTVLETDDALPFVVLEYPVDEMAFQIAPDFETGGWVAFSLRSNTPIARGRSIADCLHRGFQQKVCNAE
jgi:hypothetical protein